MNELIDYTYFITVAAIIGSLANIFKKRWGFALWAITDVAWIVIDAINGIYAQSILMAIYAGLAIWGFVRWKND